MIDLEKFSGTLQTHGETWLKMAEVEAYVAATAAPVAQVATRISDRPYSDGMEVHELVVLDASRIADGMMLYAAPIEAQSVTSSSMLGQNWSSAKYCGTCNSVIVPPNSIPNTYAFCRCVKVQTLAAPSAQPAAQQAAGSIDTPEFRDLMFAFRSASPGAGADTRLHAVIRHIDSRASLAASVAQPVPEPAGKALPSLPKAFGTIEIYGDDGHVKSVDGWTADQMRGYVIDDRLRRATTAPVAQPSQAVPAGLIEALKFYADGDHLMLADKDAWDTVSGEPQNLLCDEAGTATVEDGTIAKRALKNLAAPAAPTPGAAK